MRCPQCDAENDALNESCFTCGRSLDALTLGLVLLGRYEVRAQLGRGGMGRVYEAFDRVLEESVAIKVLRAELADPEISRRFLSEIKLARKVSHRNVCRIHEYGEDAGISFLSMEHIAGRSLKEHLALQRPTLSEAFGLALQVGEGLAAIHEHGIVHRDLKSGNVMVDLAGVPKILDFGIAKQVGAPGLTTGDRVFGTPEYMSPEQVAGAKVDARSDVYALGCVVYEIFAGRPPFQGENPYATLLKHINETPLFDAVPRALAEPLARALAKDPLQRFTTVADFNAALRAARDATLPSTGPAERVATHPPGATPAPYPPNTVTMFRHRLARSRHFPWILAAASAVFALGLVSLLSRRTEVAPEASTLVPVQVSRPGAPAPPSTTPAAPTKTALSIPAPATRPAPAPTATLARGAPTRSAASPPKPEPRPAPAASAVPAGSAAPAPVTTGTLALIVVPDAEVVLDGSSIGVLGRRELALEAGPHALEVRHRDYQPLPRRIAIRAGETLTLLLDLQEKGIRKPRK